MTVIHVFYQSLPDVKGASIRGRDIVVSQLEIGLDPVVITCPFQRSLRPGAQSELIDGVEYVRTYNGRAYQDIGEVSRSPMHRLGKLISIVKFAIDVRRLAKQRGARLIHAHSMFYCGFAAWFAARTLGIPFIYEVRSLWEDRPHVRAGVFGGMQVLAAKKLESLVAKLADSVVAISRGLMEDLIRRGVSPQKITVVPNGVRIPKDRVVRSRSMAAAPVFGYVGNISEIESLDLLISSAVDLTAEGYKLRVRIVGDGPAKASLVRLASSAPSGLIEFLDPVCPAQVPEVYRRIDVSVLARRRTALTDSVTPLKPLEAAALGVPVLSSDLLAMRELMGDECCLFFEADSVSSLKLAIKQILERQVDLMEISSKAIDLVESKRSWASHAEKYAAIYSGLQSEFRS